VDQEIGKLAMALEKVFDILGSIKSNQEERNAYMNPQL
jgi:hypothetical protein